jgi:hypothetical protein
MPKLWEIEDLAVVALHDSAEKQKCGYYRAGISKVGGKSVLLEVGLRKGGKFRSTFPGDGAMVKQRQSEAAVKLDEDQEELAQRIYQRLRTKMDEELLAMARLMASKQPHEIFGKGEFELRDKLNQVGATIVAEAANERSKKGVPR